MPRIRSERVISSTQADNTTRKFIRQPTIVRESPSSGTTQPNQLKKQKARVMTPGPTEDEFLRQLKTRMIVQSFVKKSKDQS